MAFLIREILLRVRQHQASVMSNRNHTAEKAVYDALSSVFNEIPADRSKTKLKADMQTHSSDPELADIIGTYGLLNVKKTALLLHKNDVFSSKPVAQEYFKTAIQDGESSPATALCTPAPADKETVISTETRVPLSAQHLLLTKVQVELEAACFEFAKAKVPVNLKENDWTCAEAVELNLIARELGKHQQHLPGVLALSKDATIGKLLRSMESIRHANVHREYLNAKDLLVMLKDSEDLLILLKDEKRISSIMDLRRAVNTCIIELDGDETNIKESIAASHATVAAQIVRLKLQEDEAIAQAESQRVALHSLYAERITAMITNFDVHKAVETQQPSFCAATATALLSFACLMRCIIILLFGIARRLFAVLARLFAE